MGTNYALESGIGSSELFLVGRPVRNIACACKRPDAPNLGQTLHLMYNAGVNGRLSAKMGRILKMIESKAARLSAFMSRRAAANAWLTP